MMKLTHCLTLAACLAWYSGASHGGNHYPIVLVHGFTGWGPEEMAGYHYWGGSDDIAANLTAAAHPTSVGVVGPLSSNWDRACELYAFIKGGRVDYGAAHAARFGHKRFGRTFTGLLPDWGESGHHARVHLVGHSQGGQTIRVLTALLERGDAEEKQGQQEDNLHPLFQGSQSLVHSVTTLATPHDGSTLAMMLEDDAGYLLSWLLSLVSYVSKSFADAPSYDFKLDQWDISQRSGEDDEAYRQRLLESGIWDQADISIHDLSPLGARELNRRFPAVNSVYYFSWATLDTVPGPLGKGYLPAPGINPALLIPAVALSKYSNDQRGDGLPRFNQSWWPNDGVVNTVSMSGPKIGSKDRIMNIGEGETWTEFQPGMWYFMGVKTGWDHLDIVGLQTEVNYTEFYLRLAETLSTLPQAPRPED